MKCRCGKKRPYFNFESETKAICCNDCKEPGMINIKDRKCRCGKKIPSFNFESETKAICCNDCKEPGMIDIKHRKCRCGKKRPNFNFESETKAICCNDCKESGMIDIKNRKCRCGKKIPYFNFESETKAICCNDCKEPGMIDIKNRKCRCGKKQPCFNFESETKAICCNDCKKPGMIDIKHRKCLCGKKQPCFNFESETKAICCNNCKEPGMINIKHRKCLCGTRASYGFPRNFPKMCVQHKQEGMISKPRARCLKNCKEPAEYGIQRPIHCIAHKDENDINLVERKCINCGKIDVLTEDNVCINFCSKEEEYKIYQKQQKVKETRVGKLLTDKFGEPNTHDKIIDSVCGKDDRSRPDFVYNCNTHIVIVEVDEHQHRNNCSVGEINRMKNLFFAYEGTPVVFIRYNPDNFVFRGKKGDIPQGKREDVLLKWVDKAINTLPNFSLSVVHLFYDGYKDTTKEFLEIDPYFYDELVCECQEVFYVPCVFEEHCYGCK